MKFSTSVHAFALAFSIYSCFLFFGVKTVSSQINPLGSPSSIISDSLQAIWNDEVAAFDAEGGIISIHVPDLWTWRGATGNARISPNIAADTSFSFRIASLSKSFVASALLKLQEQSVLDLDDNIGMYLDAALFNTIPNGSSISIRHLLNHTSGIADYLSSPAYLLALFNLGLNHNFTPEQLVAYGVAGSPLFTPGNGWAYSNTNYTLAALVIEGATSGDYETFITNNLLNPLGLSDTYFPTTNALPGNYMGSYTDIDNNGSKDDFSVFSPSNTFGSGPLVSKLGDVLKWMELLEDGQVLSAASMAEMKTYVNATIPGVDYGLGLGLYSNSNYSSIGHTGSIFNTSNMQHFPAEDFYVAFNVTDLDFPAYDLTDRLYQYLAPLLDSCRNFSPQIATPIQTGISQGQSVNLQATSGSNYTYQWSLNGQILNGANGNNFQATTAGDYSVLITDGIGCQHQTLEVSLIDCQNYQVNISPNQNTLDVCPQTPVNLTAGTSADSVNWYDMSGNPLQISSNTFSFPASATTTIVMRANDQLGCQALDTIQVIVANIPQPELGADQTICMGESVTLSTGTNGNTINWRDLSGSLLLSNSNNYNLVVNGSISIIADVIHDCGIEKDTIHITAVPLPEIDLGGDLNVCEQDSVELLADFEGDIVNWYDQNFQILLSDSDKYSFLATQNRTIIAEVTSECGFEYDTIQISVSNQAILDLGPDRFACQGSVISLHAGSSADTVSWFDYEGNLLLQESNRYEFTITSDDTLIASMHASCGLAMDTIIIFALPLPEINLGEDTAYSPGDTVHLSPNVSAGTTISWLDIAGNVLANTPDYEFVFEDEIRLIALAERNGCMSSDTVHLSLATGLELETLSDFLVFPNPAKDQIQLRAKWKQATQASVNLISASGERVFRKSIPPGDHIDLQINLIHFSAGLYILVLESENGMISRKLRIE